VGHHGRIFFQRFAEQLRDEIASGVVRGWPKPTGGDDQGGARERFPNCLFDVSSAIGNGDLPAHDITEIGQAAAKPLLMRVEDTPQQQLAACVDELSIQYSVFSIQYSVFSIQYSVFSIQ
jgi:hypothetical protein